MQSTTFAIAKDSIVNDNLFLEQATNKGVISSGELRNLIVASLKEQGFVVEGDEVLVPNESKETLRLLHRAAIKNKIDKAKSQFFTKEKELLAFIANGNEINPAKLKPQIVQVQTQSDALLFRYASLHWSIPVSAGYGRRLRFLIMDEYNGKLIGIIGLGDPVFSLAARDSWIGWDKEARRRRLCHVMDAFVLGAVPPYSFLLCGKLIALLAVSNEVRQAFKHKYENSNSIITKRNFNGHLALITTSSALGRSSIYNRLKFGNRLIYKSVGYTKGTGEFHFANALYEKIFSYVNANCLPTAKHSLWGNGFRNRREVIRKCLKSLGLSANWIKHGVKREVFVVPLAENSSEFLKGKEVKLKYFNQSAEILFNFFSERWLLPRAKRDKRYLQFKAEMYRLYKDE